MSVLDDLKMIHNRDAQDALGIAGKQWQQLGHVFEVPDLHAEYKNVVFAGMGGSSLGAMLSQTWPGYNVPFEICKSYDIPAYVGEQTLFIASSYSGNTEETLSALDQALERGAHVVVVASGGQLQQKANDLSLPFVLLPQASQPRYAVLYGVKALVTILERAGLVAEASAESSMHQTADFLKKSLECWAVDVPTKDNYAKQIALELVGSSVVIYGGPKFFPAVYKWKISMNENAKNISWCNQLPEFNHNEFLGWTSHPVEKPYKVIDLRSTFEHERVQKRFVVTDRLLSGKRPAAIVVQAQGDFLLEQLLWTVALGDFVSLYLALLNGLNPTPVDLIEKFKKELNE